MYQKFTRMGTSIPIPTASDMDHCQISLDTDEQDLRNACNVAELTQTVLRNYGKSLAELTNVIRVTTGQTRLAH
jgi:U3 small nucleolar ribonucleoprotein component